MEISIELPTTLSGDSLWAQGNAKGQSVVIHSLVADEPTEDEEEHLYLYAYFDPQEWPVKTQGLIYTDNGFLSTFHTSLVQAGLSRESAESIDYTEQGMQGEDCVSLCMSGVENVRDFLFWMGKMAATPNPPKHKKP